MPKAGDIFNPHRTFTGIFIPEGMARFKPLRPAAKMVWGRLARYAGEAGEAYPRITVLAEEVGLGESQTHEYVKELIDQQFIIREPREGKSNVFRFLWHPCFDGEVGEARTRGNSFGSEEEVPVRKSGRVEGRPEERTGTRPEERTPTRPEERTIRESVEESHVRESEIPPTPSSKIKSKDPEALAGAKLVKSRLGRFSKERLNSGAMNWIARRLEKLGADSDRVARALDEFTELDYWRGYANVAAAFIKWLEELDCGKPLGSSKGVPSGRAETNQGAISGTGPVSVDPPEAPWTSQPPERDFPAEWNRLVPACPVEWNSRRDGRLLRDARLDRDFDARFEEVCKLAQQIHAARGEDSNWLTFQWVLKTEKGSGRANWWRVLTDLKGMAKQGRGSRSGNQSERAAQELIDSLRSKKTENAHGTNG